MFDHSFFATPKQTDVEDDQLSLKRYKRQQVQSFASWKWLLLSCGSAAILSLAAHSLHARVVRSQSHRHQALPHVVLPGPHNEKNKVHVVTATSHESAHATQGKLVMNPSALSPEFVPPPVEETPPRPAVETTILSNLGDSAEKALVEPTSSDKPILENKFLTGEEFHLCNAAVPSAELSGAMPDAILTEPCGDLDARRIAAALQSFGYNFESVLPQPYIYPAYLQQVLWMLSGEPLSMALKHLLAHASHGPLGVLVRFFAWGLPVAMNDLEAALDRSTMDSLRTCGVIAKCKKLENKVISSIMIFPVPNSSLLIATDWASRSTLGMHEEVVPIVDPEGMALVYNTPQAKGLKVLDYEAGSGVQGFIAGLRGAAEVTMFSHSPRVDRFIRFSSWMNGITVKVLGRRNQLTDVFDLMLAQPPFLPVPDAQAAAKYTRNGGKDGTKALRDVLKVATQVLGASGILALFTEFNAEDLINRESTKGICQMGLPGFSGTTVIRSQPLQPDAYAFAHADVANIEEQVANMGKEGITGISSGFLFAKRQEMLQKDECGEISLQLLEDPIKWPTMASSKYDRACYLSQETQCPDKVKE